MRTSCDVDILVEEKNLQTALDALQNRLSYTVSARGTHDVQTTAPSGVSVELHYRLAEDGKEKADEQSRQAAPLRSVFDDAVKSEEGSCRYLLSPELFYYYHVYHMAKHFQNGGCGVRPFLDLFVMRSFAYDEEKKKRLLTEGGLDAFAKAAEKLTSVWFENEEGDDLSHMMEEFLLSGGTYGNLKNKAQLQTAKKGKFRYFLSRIFLPYDALRYRYPTLERHRWFLPFFEVRRWFEIVFSGRIKRGTAELSAVSQKNGEEVLRVRAMLSELGLSSDNSEIV